jgi:hypothetical protein
MARYAGLARAYGTYLIDSTSPSGKRKGAAQTLQRPVTLALWEQHLRGEAQIGIVPIRDDATCVFGVVDVDDYKLDHDALAAKIKKLKLPLVHIRSKSGGAHLTLFLKEPHPAAAVRERLADWAAALGHSGVEIFPKQDRLLSSGDTGNWINMPYSGGDASDRCALREGARLTVEEFLKVADRAATKLEEAPATDEDPPDLLEEGPPCLIALARDGIGEGGRNTTVFNMGVYCRKRWPDDWPERLRELNAQFVTPPLPDQELVQVIAHLERKEYTYTCKDKPLSPLCKKNLCLKRTHGIGPADAQEYFGIDLKNIVRVEYQEPTYYADFNGKRFSFQSEDVNSQTKFRELLIKQVNDAFMPIPNVRWAQFIIQLCNKAELIEAPPETRANAELFGWLEDYCTEQLPARELRDVLDGQVFEDRGAGRMLFLPRKWLSHINREHRTRHQISDAYKALQPLGVMSESHEIGGRTYKLWSVATFARPAKNAPSDM